MTVKKSMEKRFLKRQFLTAPEYLTNRYLLAAVLKDGMTYTKSEVDALIADVEKRIIEE